MELASFETAIEESPPQTKWRWPTVIFAAVPATLLAFPAALAIFFGGLFSLSLKPVAFAMFIGGVLGWVGMISLWIAARTSGVVTKRTARGLVGGIIAVAIYYLFAIFSDDTAARFGKFTPLLTIGPLFFAIAYLGRYRAQPRLSATRPRSGPPPLPSQSVVADGPPPLPSQSVVVEKDGKPAAQPINEGRMRRILELLLIIPAVIELIFVPSLIENPPGLGILYIIFIGFPPLLGIIVTAAWCFWRSPALRWLAGATLLTPILLPFLLSLMANLLGHDLTAQISLYTAIAIPILMLLILPKKVAGYLPRSTVDGRRFNVAWVWLQVTMLVIGVLLAVLFGFFRESATQGLFSFVLFHSGAMIVVAIITWILAYIGLRAQQQRQTKLRITQIILSVFMLLMAVPATIFILLIFGLAGLG